jgi:hypothetical protein
MNDLIAQGDQGAFTFGEFAKNAPAVFSAYSVIGITPEHIRKANAAMQILQAGTKSADIAVTALNSTMAELSEPDKQRKLRNLGIAVRDSNGDFRDFNDIMFDIVARAEKMGNADYFGTIFGAISMKAVRAYMTQGERMYDSLINLGDTTGLLEQKSATMADTLKSNIQNLQTAFLSFADKNLTEPLQKLTDLLNKLAENPEKIEAGIRSITRVLLGLGAVKLGAGIVSFIANLNSLKSGGGLNVDGLASAGGGAGIPVHVTNWGGTPSMPGGNMGLSGIQTGGGLVDQYGNPLSSQVPPAAGKPLPPNQPANKRGFNKVNWRGAAAAAGVSAAITAGLTIPGMIKDLNEIAKSEDLTDLEKGKAKGGAIGETAGAIGGAAAGALAGAAIGSVVPVVGTALGAIVGGLIGQFGGPVGRAIGEKIGTAAAENKELDAAQNSYKKALEEAADTIGKTEEEIEKARWKLTEAEARLEKAKEAGEAKKAEEEKKKRAYEELVNLRVSEYSHQGGQSWPQTVRTGNDAAATYGGYIYRGYKQPLVNAGLPAVNNRHQTFQGAPGIAQYNTNTSSTQAVNDLIITPQGQFNTHPDDYIFAMKNPAALITAGIAAVNNRYQTFQGAPGIVQYNTNTSSAQAVNDLIITPQGQFNTHPDDYIFAMKNPAALVNAALPGELKNEVRTVERVPPAIPPVVVEGEIELRSELTIDDKGYRLRQSVGKNTTPYKFAVGSVKNARLIQ